MQKPDKKYKGVIIPMISPINEDFTIDVEAVEKILETFIQADVDPFLLGTTGESVSLSIRQKYDLIKNVTSLLNKRKIYAGISSNSLLESIEESIRYSDLGVDAVVAHLPFYYPLSDNQMLKYYEQLANSVPCPLFIYNNPITTNISIPIHIIEKLSYHNNIVGVKDSERSKERLDKAIQLWSNRTDFAHLVGWAAQSSYTLLNGSDGIVPSTGNLIPGLYKDLYDFATKGNRIKANEIQEKTDKISDIYQKNRNLNQSLPALKYMMSLYGLCKPHVMPPLYSLDNKECETIKNAMAHEMVTIFKLDNVE